MSNFYNEAKLEHFKYIFKTIKYIFDKTYMTNIYASIHPDIFTSIVHCICDKRWWINYNEIIMIFSDMPNMYLKDINCIGDGVTQCSAVLRGNIIITTINITYVHRWWTIATKIAPPAPLRLMRPHTVSCIPCLIFHKKNRKLQNVFTMSRLILSKS